MDKQLPDDVVEKILRARDALILGDRNEAYHQLYGIANPGYDSYFPWHEMEQQIGYKEYSETEIKERRQVTEYATKMNALQARCDRYEKALKAIGNGCATPQYRANEALNGGVEAAKPMEYNTCKTCGAGGGKTGEITIHTNLSRTQDELNKTFAILNQKEDKQ